MRGVLFGDYIFTFLFFVNLVVLSVAVSPVKHDNDAATARNCVILSEFPFSFLPLSVLYLTLFLSVFSLGV